MKKITENQQNKNENKIIKHNKQLTKTLKITEN